MEVIVGVDGPQDKITLLDVICRLAPKWPESVGVFAWAAGPADEGIGQSPFMETLFPVFGVGKKGPKQRGVIASLGTLDGIKWE